jgi:DNA-binding NarL/FixJ family response regulator
MIRVLIVTNVGLWSDLIRFTCASQPDITVSGCVNTKPQALAERDDCDVMLVSHDVQDNLELIKAIGPGMLPAVVMIGLPNIEPLILRYLEAGAAGCIREQDSSEELVRTIRLAAARQRVLNPDIAPIVLKRVSALSQHARTGSPFDRFQEKTLTRREREILHLIAQGYGNREIARTLTIELGTAKNHVHNILEKLNVKTRQDAAIYFSLGLA